MPVVTMVLFRFAFACVGLAPVFLHDRPRFAFHECGWLLAAAFFGVPVQFLVQFKGLSLTTVSHAALMVGTLPVLLALAAMMFSGERLHLGGWIGLAASTAGAALIAMSGRESGSTGPSVMGDLLVVISMFAAIAWILISKRLIRQHSAVIVTAVVLWIGTVMLLLMGLAMEGLPALHYSARTWAAVAAQGLLATTITTLLWNWGLSRVPASEAGIFVNLEPFVGAILGVFLLHENLGPAALLGGALIIGGAVYFSLKPA